ncbi:restriction endonuclease-related protein [Streptomyces anulatus]|uniref:restriction endonuclease-related protein n=1 Tax=Streptomyces anulatus TaxID=1892 RepID=UPI0036B5F07A
MFAAADVVSGEMDELDQEQREALDACVIAAMTWCAPEGDVRARMRLLMECHGRYVRACGIFGEAASFPDFLDRLRHAPVGDLLPGSGSWSQIYNERLLEDDGTATAVLIRLVMEASEKAQEVPGMGADLRHVHSVLRALGKLPVGTRLSRITAEAVQHAVFRALLDAGFAAYTQGRETLILSPAMARRALARHAHLVDLGVYTAVSPMRQFAGWWAPCPLCRWTMRAIPKGRHTAELLCEDVRHVERGARFRMSSQDGHWRLEPCGGEIRDAPELLPVEGHIALSYGLWQWIVVPGLLEIELKDLAEAAGAEVRLWPFGDSYDLHIAKNGVTWRVDVKTWADPQGIAEQMRNDPEGCSGLILVIPEHLSGYKGVLARVLGPLGARVITDVALINEVIAA